MAQDSTDPPEGHIVRVYPSEGAEDNTTVEYTLYRGLLGLRLICSQHRCDTWPWNDYSPHMGIQEEDGSRQLA